MNQDISELRAACHCGSVRFTVVPTNGLRQVRRCNCSMCRMRGAVVISTTLDGIRFLAGEELLTLYQFNTHTAQHYFCSRCGIYTHHHRRSTPNEISVNVACLEGISPFDFPEVPVLDGEHHPSDGFRLGVAGTLIFKPAS